MTSETDVTQTDAIEAPGPVASGRRRGAARIVIIVAAAVVGLAVLGGGVLAVADRSFAGSGKVARNVTIQGVVVEGMTAEEAAGAVNSQWASTLPEEITITFPGDSTDAPGEWTSSPEGIGVTLAVGEAVDDALMLGREGDLPTRLVTRLRAMRAGVDVPVHRHVDEELLGAAIEGLVEVVDREPVDADISVEGDEVKVVPGKVGRALDVAATLSQLARTLEDPTANSVEAVVETTMPNVTAEDLADIEVVLGQFTTKFKPWKTNRTHNLRLAAEALNETVIKPGEVMSLNTRIGERLTERGYRPAPIFLEGEVKPSTGGGVCQIATTTYNAALLTNLDIVERHHHSRPVDYAPTGQDATVYWGQYDLKIRNNLTHALLLVVEMGENTLTMKFLGSREDDYDVEITRTGLSRIGYGTKEQPDPELEEGKREVEKEGRSGWRVNVFRKVTREGEVIRDEKLHSDYYGPQTKVIRVGTKPPDEALEDGAETGEGAPADATLAPGEPARIAPADGGDVTTP
jgi:vancomycin resistance protein YoaR